MRTIRMTRSADEWSEPHTADVHPDEVENYAAAGFAPADPLDHDGDGRKGGSLPGRRGRGKGSNG